MKKLVLVIIVFSLVAYGAVVYAQGPGMMGHDMTGDDMMGSAQDKESQGQNTGAGADIFKANCQACHVDGGNIMNPEMPLHGSDKLADFETFLAFIRNPTLFDGSRGAMPSFSDSQISYKQAEELYHFIITSESSLMSGGQKEWSCPRSSHCKGFHKRYPLGPGMMGGQGMGYGMMGGAPQGWNYCPYCGNYIGQRGGSGMMGGQGMMGMMHGGHGMGQGMMGSGYGMGPGMMRGGMMGPGMIGPGNYRQSADCQKFLDETSDLRKDFHNKKFEYMEAFRNPNASPESLRELHDELSEIHGEIQAKAPQGCWAQ